jgi:hypothetical protein
MTKENSLTPLTSRRSSYHGARPTEQMPLGECHGRSLRQPLYCNSFRGLATRRLIEQISAPMAMCKDPTVQLASLGTRELQALTTSSSHSGGRVSAYESNQPTS